MADLARSFNRAADRIQQLVEAQRRQLAFASHELRSPLARLRVSLEMMAGEPALKEQAARDVGELDALIGELLEASRLEALGRPDRDEAVDLLGLVAEEAAQGRGRGRGRAGGAARGPAAPAPPGPQPARERAPPRGRRSRRGPGRARRDRARGCTVADRGPGVPEAERERIFEPFYRPPGAPETGAGHGLGLALVRQIARAHGGDARCLAREGGGTVLEVTLGA